MNSLAKNSASVVVCLATLLALASGCISKRADVYTDVRNIGSDIKTCHRYKIAAYEWICPEELKAAYKNPGNLFVGEDKLNEMCKAVEQGMVTHYSHSCSAALPNVFSDAGVPIVLKEVSGTHDNGLPPTFLLSILSLYIFPVWVQQSEEVVLSIRSAVTGIEIGKVAVWKRSKAVMSSIVPSSWLLNDECAEGAKGGEYAASFSEKNKIFFNSSLSSYFEAADGVVAHAIACKLKGVEDTGAFDVFFGGTAK